MREMITKEAVALPQYSIGCASNDFAADTILQADVAVAAARNLDDHAYAQCPHHVKPWRRCSYSQGMGTVTYADQIGAFRELSLVLTRGLFLSLSLPCARVASMPRFTSEMMSKAVYLFSEMVPGRPFTDDKRPAAFKSTRKDAADSALSFAHLQSAIACQD